MRARVLVGLAWVVACHAQSQPGEALAPVGAAPSSATLPSAASNAAPTGTASAATPTRTLKVVAVHSRLAESALTPLAHEFELLTSILLSGRDPSESKLPIEPFEPTQKLVHARGHPSGNLETVFFSAGVSIPMLGHDDAISAKYGPHHVALGTVNVYFVLTPARLLVASVDATSQSRPVPLPGSLSPVETVSRKFVHDLRAGKEKSWMLTPADQPALERENIWDPEVYKSAADARAKVIAKKSKSGEPLGFHLYSVELVARDEAGTLWDFRYSLEGIAGPHTIASDPILVMKRLER